MSPARASRPRAAAVVLMLGAALVAGCEAGGQAPAGGAAQGEGDGAAPAPPAPEALQDGVEVAPGTRVLGAGVGATASGWYAALELGEASPREVADFYRQHLAELGFTVQAPADPSTVDVPSTVADPTAVADPSADSLTVVGDRPTGPTRQVRVDVVPQSGEVPGFARVVART